jgi:hypothetical protein
VGLPGCGPPGVPRPHRPDETLEVALLPAGQEHADLEGVVYIAVQRGGLGPVVRAAEHRVEGVHFMERQHPRRRTHGMQRSAIGRSETPHKRIVHNRKLTVQ